MNLSKINDSFFKAFFYGPKIYFWGNVKGKGSILFLKNGLKKNCRKNYKNHLRRNKYVVCTAVARCFPIILDAVVLENINLFEVRMSTNSWLFE
jgi:hypothetical protein